MDPETDRGLIQKFDVAFAASSRPSRLLIQFLLLCAAELVTSVACADEPSLARGTKQLGGQFRFDYVRDLYGAHARGYSLAVVPGFGYFVADDFEVRVGVTVLAQWASLYSGSTQTFGFDGGLRYHVRLAPGAAAYAGIVFGPALAIPDTGPSATTLITAVPFGLLIGLNRYVAVDVGARGEYSTLASTHAGSTLKLSAGYFGVDAFFD
jgi:hypothetical protein